MAHPLEARTLNLQVHLVHVAVGDWGGLEPD